MTGDLRDAALDPLDLEPRQPTLDLRKRLEELGRIGLLVFILASAAFLSAITAMRIAIHGREVAMPNLVGMNVTEAAPCCALAGWFCASRTALTASVPSTWSSGKRRRLAC